MNYTSNRQFSYSFLLRDVSFHCTFGLCAANQFLRRKYTLEQMGFPLVLSLPLFEWVIDLVGFPFSSSKCLCFPFYNLRNLEQNLFSLSFPFDIVSPFSKWTRETLPLL